MRYHIDTIPVWDAAKIGGECLLCALQRRVELQQIEYSLGASVMEPDVRIQVNKKGFCQHHQRMLFKGDNRLGHALMLESHLTETRGKLNKAFNDIRKAASGNSSFLDRLSGKTPSPAKAMEAAVQQAGAQYIVLAGYMRILSDAFVTRWAGRMLNIHPSLLPKYQGVKTHARAIAAGDTVHGASVHFVTEELDGGPVVLQARVPIFPDDDEVTLAERVLSQEHQIYPLVVNWFCQGRLTMVGTQACLDGQPLPARGYASDDEEFIDSELSD